MFTAASLKRNLPPNSQTLDGRKNQLQMRLTNTGTLELPPPPPPPVTQPIQQALPKRKVYNVSARDQVTARVELPTPNFSGQLITKLSGVIKGKVIRIGEEVVVKFIRDDTHRSVKLKGKIPVVDNGLHYTLEARQAWLNGSQIYYFQKICPQGLVALPVNGIYFRNLVKQRLGANNDIATAIAMIVAEKFAPADPKMSTIQKLTNTEIPISHIYDNFQTHDWFPELRDKWNKLRNKFYPDLLMFWDYSELSRLSLSDLNQLYLQLKRQPLNFCLTNYREGRLKALPETKFELFKQILNVDFTPKMRALVKFFNAFSEEIMETKCLAAPLDHLQKLAENVCPAYSSEVVRMALSAEYSLLKGAYEKELQLDPNRIGNNLMRFYRFRDLADLRVIKARLNQIMARPPDCIEPLEGVVPMRLKKEQQRAVTAITSKVNVVMLSGDGGTGKTLTSKSVYQMYGGLRCLAVAAYTALATRNQRAFSEKQLVRGMTIDLVIESIVRGTQQGKKIAALTEVLILDEAGVVPMEKFARLLELLPNIKKIFMTGDLKQCRPVTAGRVLDGFVQSWAGTEQLLYLTKNRRVDKNSRLLVENFSAFLKGDFAAMTFTTDMLNDIPFKIIKRLDYSGLGENADARCGLMLRELQPIYYSLKPLNVESSQLRIIAQTHSDVELLNHAWMSLTRAGKPYSRDENVFYPGDLVRFKQPFTHTYRGKRTIVPGHLKCDVISTNNVAEIQEIYDISCTEPAVVAYRNRKMVSSTAHEYVSGDTLRMISFTDGTKLNLRDYNLANIVPGYASTILSTIGHECDYVIVWISPWQRHFYRELLYTAITRAKKCVYVVMNISEDMNLAKSDMARIWTHVPTPTENVIACYIPRVGVPDVDLLDKLFENMPDFNTFVFNPTSELEKDAFEETMRKYESVCPMIGDNYLEKETEKILKRNASLVGESQFTDDLSGGFDSDHSEADPPLAIHRRVIDLDRTHTLDLDLPTPREISPRQSKRHFGWITEEKKRRDKNSSPIFEEIPSKRLKRQNTNEWDLQIEEMDTLLDDENLSNSDLFEEPFEGNPFDFVSNKKIKKSRSTILDD